MRKIEFISNKPVIQYKYKESFGYLMFTLTNNSDKKTIVFDSK